MGDPVSLPNPGLAAKRPGRSSDRALLMFPFSEQAKSPRIVREGWAWCPCPHLRTVRELRLPND